MSKVIYLWTRGRSVPRWRGRKKKRKKHKLPDIWEDNLAAPPAPALSFHLLSTTALAENQCWATATVSPRSPPPINSSPSGAQALTSSMLSPAWSRTRLDLPLTINSIRKLVRRAAALFLKGPLIHPVSGLRFSSWTPHVINYPKISLDLQKNCIQL